MDVLAWVLVVLFLIGWAWQQVREWARVFEDHESVVNAFAVLSWSLWVAADVWAFQHLFRLR